MSFSVLRVFAYSDSAAFVAVQMETETDKSVSAPRRSFHHHLLSSLEEQVGEVLEGRGGSLAQTDDTIAAHFSASFYSSVKGGSYPEIKAQHNAEGEGFHLYLVVNGRCRFFVLV